MEQQHFSVSLHWPVIDHHRVLVATFVRNKDRRLYCAPGDDFRLVCNKKENRAAVMYRAKRTARSITLSEPLRGFGCGASSCYPEISKKDELALGKWLGCKAGKTRNHYMEELEAWVEQAVQAETLERNDARGELRDEDVFSCPEELPESLEAYIRQKVLPEDSVLLYKKGNVRGLCYQCRERVRALPGQRFRQREITHCPNCGRQVMALLETSDAFGVDYVENIAAIQKKEDILFIRQWHLCRDSTAQWENIEAQLEEVARYAIRGNRVAKWQREAKENYYMNTCRYRLDDWTRVKNVAEVYDGSYYFFFPENWREVLAGTSLRYCDLSGYATTQQRNWIRTNPIRYLLDWARYPAIEKFWKAGYEKLIVERIQGCTKETKNTIRWSRDSIQQALRFPVRLLKIHAPEDWTMERAKRTTDMWALVEAGRMKESELVELESVDARIEDIKLALGHATARKILNYLERQKARQPKRGTENVGGTYRDYLEDCVKLGMDLEDRAVLFPQDLNAAHARTNGIIKYKVTPENEAKFTKQVKKLDKLSWAKDGLLIRPAASMEELIAEGSALSHCVGGYASRMADGETAIFFIREEKEPDQPFFTLELRDGKVIQCRTKHNKSYTLDEAVHRFVEQWEESVVNKKAKKQRGTAA